MRTSFGALRLLLVAAVVAVAVPNVADAQTSADARARTAFERGARAFDAGAFEESLTAFTQAFELSNRPELLYNVGLAQDRLRMDARALDSFRRYLAAVPDSPFRTQVESRITALSEAEARRDAERQSLEAARLAAEQAEQAAEAQSQEREQAAIRARADADASRQAAQESERQRALAEQERQEAEERAARERPSRWWIGVIVGVVVIGAGIGLGVGLSGGGDEFAQSDFGEVTQTLGSF